VSITKEILEKLYFDDDLTVAEIGKVFNRSSSTISYYIKKFGIKTNGGKKNTVKIKKEDIERLYIEEDLKSAEVAKILHVSLQTLLKYIHKYQIPIKGIKYYNTLPEIKFDKDQYDFFDGLILTDGSLVQRNTSCSSGKSNAKISCAFKHEEFTNYIDMALKLNGNVHKKVHVSDRYKSGRCITYGLFSSDNILFTKERNRWYPNGIKIIPSDFRFSPVSMNIAYLSDGSYIRNAVHFSLNSFSADNINNTIGRYFNEMGIKFSIYSNNTVRISVKSTLDFFNYIGGCPVSCYNYKWPVASNK
jgi:predicted DNA-binding protein YlxM (UPF0122 family)